MSPRAHYAIDFHVHTAHSFDSLTPPRLAVEIARRRGLDGIAITDHDTIDGAVEAVKANPYSDFLVIPGIEVKSDAGDVIGLYVTNDVRSRRFEDVIAEIKEQGGVVYLPHPVRTFGAHNLPALHARSLSIDVWERYNGRYSAGEFAGADAAYREMPAVASFCGSDAHFPWEIGVFRTLLDRIPSDAQTLLSMRYGGRLIASPRGELPLRAGITLGAMIKDLKRKRYAKLGALTVSLPWRALRRTARLGLDRLRG